MVFVAQIALNGVSMWPMIRRSAMRAILFDPDLRQVLLIKALVPDTGAQLWFTPGGGINEGETELACLAREVAEETGLKEIPAAYPVWRRREKFVFMGEHYDQFELYFFVPVSRFEVSERRLEPHETETFMGVQWWSIDELDQSPEVFVPGDMAQLLQELEAQWREGRLPTEPQRVGR